MSSEDVGKRRRALISQREEVERRALAREVHSLEMSVCSIEEGLIATTADVHAVRRRASAAEAARDKAYDAAAICVMRAEEEAMRDAGGPIAMLKTAVGVSEQRRRSLQSQLDEASMLLTCAPPHCTIPPAALVIM